MSELRRHAEDYLKLRRSLGFKLTLHGRLLPQFVDYLDAAGATTVTTELAISFAQLPQGVQPVQWAHRLSMVRGFARYLQAIDPATEVPPHDVFAARYQRPTPYLWQETEVLDLMAAARQSPPSAVRAHLRVLLRAPLGDGHEDRGDDRPPAGRRRPHPGRHHGAPSQARTLEARPVAAEQHRRSRLLRGRSRDRLCPRPGSQAFFVSSRRHRVGPPGRATGIPPPRCQDWPAHRDQEAPCP